jgi:hypothetical protein
VSVTVQGILELIVIVFEPAAEVKERLPGLTDNLGCSPFWITVTVLVVTPIPVTVICPDFSSVVIFGEQETQTVSLLVPVVLFNVTCAIDSASVQFVFDFTRKNCVPPTALKFMLVGFISINPGTPV